MPRSLHDILQHADELASRFEQLDPDEMKAIPVEEYLLDRAVIARARSEAALIDAITRARLAGLTWQRIGESIGTSAQGAQQRYGHLLEAS
ncbi:MAG: hypothetical protein RJB65_1731 [Actinomycetota bacterium]|jgi:hypothetical protein